ncbi:MAG: FAD-binding protein, partial [Acidobacteria bacterium]|nr:FAD-binding protein [Acidobacteriota bacterium]
MTEIRKDPAVFDTDVLIIGGGFGGLAAAIRVKELSPETSVLIVDKQTAGWGGKANKGAGVLWVLAPGDDIDAFVDFHVNNIGIYLNDQDLLYAMARESYPAAQKLADWGVNVMKTPGGELDVNRLPFGWSLAAADLDMMQPLKKKAVKLGVRLLDKTQVVDLLKRDGRVTGAAGFSLLDGGFAVFNSKAAILANGDCDFGVMRMWANACGDGLAAAYNAGAEMRNAEFGNFYDVVNKATGIPVVFGYNCLYNAQGEKISSKYIRGPQPDIPISIILGMEKEILAGRGPIYIDMAEFARASEGGPGIFRWDRPHFRDLFGHEMAKLQKYGPPPGEKMEVSLGFTGELSAVRVDSEMKTTLPGLWAIGDASYAGSAWAGAAEAPPGRLRGSGLMNALIAALLAAPSVVGHAKETAAPVPDDREIGILKEKIFAPLNRSHGYTASEAVRKIQEVVVPVKYSMRRSRERLEEALSRVKEVQSKLHGLFADDPHGLAKCHEASCIALCAEIGFRAALARTESRGWHYREDYPERDDANWLRWIIVKKAGDNMAVTTEPVPVERYKIRPGRTETAPDAVVDHEELAGVTPEMIDWWWVNMEKGYPLWEPDDHKSFVWEVPPPLGGYLGAIQIAEEKMGPMPPMKIRIRWDDPDDCPIPRAYEHAIVASGIDPDGNVQAMILHEYEKSPRGTRMRSTMRFLGPVPAGLPEIWKKHDRAEVSTFPKFLPDLYRMWQAVKDPAINRQCSLAKGSG